MTTLPELLAQAHQAKASAAIAEGRAAAQAAWQLAADEPQPSARLEAGHLLCYFLHRAGAYTDVLAHGRELMPLLDAPSQITERIELLRWMAIAGCETGQFETALLCGHEACELSAPLGGAKRALALNALGACFERVGDPWQAERLLVDALALAREAGDVFAELVTLNNASAATIGAFYLLRDSEADAEARAALRRSVLASRAAWALLPHFDDPVYRVFVAGNLGEALLHLGETAEASELLYGALERALAGGYQSMAWRIRCSVAELLLAAGAAEQAKVSLSVLLDELNAAELRATLFRARHALYRACRLLGEDALALQHLEAYQRLERARATRQLRAQSQLFITRVEAEQTRLQAERARLEAQIARTRAAEFEAHALRDQLTGLANRRHLDAQLPGLLESADEQDLPMTLAMVDVDHFKAINDRFGHAVGDRVLVTLAQLLRENTRGSDLVARVGGEEFVLALPEAPPPRALEVCERLRARVAAFAWGQLAPGLHVTLSVGLAHAPPYAQAPLLERADAAMYRAKQQGRNQVAIA